MARDTIFISHATPEDNEFSIWIASRLEMLGYKTWIDKDKYEIAHNGIYLTKTLYNIQDYESESPTL